MSVLYAGIPAESRAGPFALSSLLNGKADLSGEMALRIEKAFGVKMDRSRECKRHSELVRPRNRQNPEARKENPRPAVRASVTLRRSRRHSDREGLAHATPDLTPIPLR